MTITHKIEEIDPARAEKILDTNTKNRKLSSGNVTKLAEQMTAGLWNFDGTPIRIDDKGDLIDGQHRLWAVVESGITLPFLVVRGVDEKAMATMDTGKSRSFADILTLEDRTLTSTNNLAAVAGVLYRWENGQRGSYLRSGHGTNVFIAFPLLLEFFMANKTRIIQLTRLGEAHAKRTGVTTSAFALGMWVFEAIDKDDSDFFFERLRDGVNLEDGSPILAFRNWMTKSYGMRPRPHLEYSIALMIKAWNSYRSGDSMQLLAWRRGGANPEPFPIPQ